MTVHVRVLGGPFFDLMFWPGDTVGDLRRMMEEATGMPMEAHRLSFQSRQLDDDTRLLVSYGVTEASLVVAVLY